MKIRPKLAYTIRIFTSSHNRKFRDRVVFGTGEFIAKDTYCFLSYCSVITVSFVQVSLMIIRFRN